MAMSPLEVRNKTFSIVKKGYERGEVHRFLDDVANELQTFAASADEAAQRASAAESEAAEARAAAGQADGSTITVAEPKVDVEPEPDPIDETPQPVAEPAPEPTSSFRTITGDDFDRVGNEISLMLRQAQESALKIRTDAEIEARTLVDQVRLDIESDRAAHEQAASELIARTEERASQLRSDAENYAAETRRAADEFAAAKRDEVESYQRDAEVAADSDRKLAAEKLESAKREAEATLLNANDKSKELIGKAAEEARAIRDELISDAQRTLAELAAAEVTSRTNLESARLSIDTALAQLRISDVPEQAEPDAELEAATDPEVGDEPDAESDDDTENDSDD